jgi:Coenzyme PQQ synthesis protein D (PqqD)
MKLTQYAKFREEKFGGVLFETRSEKVFALNPTAAALVREIGAGCDEADLITRLKERFRDSGGSLERESRSFIASLRNQGLLEE